MRLAEHFSFQATAVSGFEFSLSLMWTSFLLAIAPVLRRDAEQAGPYRIAEAEARFATAKRKVAEARELEAELRLRGHMDALAEREDAARRLPLFRDLAETTVTAAAAVATSALVGAHARNGAEDRLTEALDKHLEAAFAETTKRMRAV
jgi:hypothetical protein